MAAVYNRGFLVQIDGTTRIPVNNDSFKISDHLGSDVRIQCIDNGGCLIKCSFGKKCTIHSVNPLEPATLNSKPVVNEGEILKDGDNIQIGGKTYRWEYVDQENDISVCRGKMSFPTSKIASDVIGYERHSAPPAQFCEKSLDSECVNKEEVKPLNEAVDKPATEINTPKPLELSAKKRRLSQMNESRRSRTPISSTYKTQIVNDTIDETRMSVKSPHVSKTPTKKRVSEVHKTPKKSILAMSPFNVTNRNVTETKNEEDTVAEIVKLDTTNETLTNECTITEEDELHDSKLTISKAYHSTPKPEKHIVEFGETSKCEEHNSKSHLSEQKLDSSTLDSSRQPQNKEHSICKGDIPNNQNNNSKRESVADLTKLSSGGKTSMESRRNTRGRSSLLKKTFEERLTEDEDELLKEKSLTTPEKSENANSCTDEFHAENSPEKVTTAESKSVVNLSDKFNSVSEEERSSLSRLRTESGGGGDDDSSSAAASTSTSAANASTVVAKCTRNLSYISPPENNRSQGFMNSVVSTPNKTVSSMSATMYETDEEEEEKSFRGVDDDTRVAAGVEDSLLCSAAPTPDSKFRKRRSTGYLPFVGTPSNVYRMRTNMSTPLNKSRTAADLTTNVAASTKKLTEFKRSSERKSTPFKVKANKSSIRDSVQAHSTIYENRLDEKSVVEETDTSTNDSSRFKYVSARRIRKHSEICFGQENTITEEEDDDSIIEASFCDKFIESSLNGGGGNEVTRIVVNKSASLRYDSEEEEEEEEEMMAASTTDEEENDEEQNETANNTLDVLNKQRELKESFGVNKEYPLKSILTPMTKPRLPEKEKSAKKVTFNEPRAVFTVFEKSDAIVPQTEISLDSISSDEGELSSELHESTVATEEELATSNDGYGNESEMAELLDDTGDSQTVETPLRSATNTNEENATHSHILETSRRSTQSANKTANEEEDATDSHILETPLRSASATKKSLNKEEDSTHSHILETPLRSASSAKKSLNKEEEEEEASRIQLPELNDVVGNRSENSVFDTPVSTVGAEFTKPVHVDSVFATPTKRVRLSLNESTPKSAASQYRRCSTHLRIHNSLCTSVSINKSADCSISSLESSNLEPEEAAMSMDASDNEISETKNDIVKEETAQLEEESPTEAYANATKELEEVLAESLEKEHVQEEVAETSEKDVTKSESNVNNTVDEVERVVEATRKDDVNELNELEELLSEEGETEIVAEEKSVLSGEKGIIELEPNLNSAVDDEVEKGVRAAYKHVVNELEELVSKKSKIEIVAEGSDSLSPGLKEHGERDAEENVVISEESQETTKDLTNGFEVSNISTHNFISQEIKDTSVAEQNTMVGSTLIEKEEEEVAMKEEEQESSVQVIVTTPDNEPENSNDTLPADSNEAEKSVQMDTSTIEKTHEVLVDIDATKSNETETSAEILAISKDTEESTANEPAEVIVTSDVGTENPIEGIEVEEESIEVSSTDIRRVEVSAAHISDEEVSEVNGVTNEENGNSDEAAEADTMNSPLLEAERGDNNSVREEVTPEVGNVPELAEKDVDHVEQSNEILSTEAEESNESTEVRGQLVETTNSPEVEMVPVSVPVEKLDEPLESAADEATATMNCGETCPDDVETANSTCEPVHSVQEETLAVIADQESLTGGSASDENQRSNEVQNEEHDSEPVVKNETLSGTSSQQSEEANISTIKEEITSACSISESEEMNSCTAPKNEEVQSTDITVAENSVQETEKKTLRTRKDDGKSAEMTLPRTRGTRLARNTRPSLKPDENIPLRRSKRQADEDKVNKNEEISVSAQRLKTKSNVAALTESNSAAILSKETKETKKSKALKNIENIDPNTLESKPKNVRNTKKEAISKDEITSSTTTTTKKKHHVNEMEHDFDRVSIILPMVDPLISENENLRNSLQRIHEIINESKEEEEKASTRRKTVSKGTTKKRLLPSKVEEETEPKRTRKLATKTANEVTSTKSAKAKTTTTNASKKEAAAENSAKVPNRNGGRNLRSAAEADQEEVPAAKKVPRGRPPAAKSKESKPVTEQSARTRGALRNADNEVLPPTLATKKRSKTQDEAPAKRKTLRGVKERNEEEPSPSPPRRRATRTGAAEKPSSTQKGLIAGKRLSNDENATNAKLTRKRKIDESGSSEVGANKMPKSKVPTKTVRFASKMVEEQTESDTSSSDEGGKLATIKQTRRTAAATATKGMTRNTTRAEQTTSVVSKRNQSNETKKKRMSLRVLSKSDNSGLPVASTSKAATTKAAVGKKTTTKRTSIQGSKVQKRSKTPIRVTRSKAKQ